jgi:hypothetical protein
MKSLINGIPDDSDLYFQNTHNGKLQNSEIFGCRTKYLPTIMNLIIENSRLNMNFENTLNQLALSGQYKIYRFPLIKLETGVKRSGDNKIMEYL